MGIKLRNFAGWASQELWFVIALVVAIAGGLVGIAIYLPHVMTAAAIDAAYRSNIEVADQIKITRGYYTKSVVAKAIETSSLTPSYRHEDEPYSIPLPATFVHDISELLKARDTSLSLVSPYPWPHRANRRMDEFQERAWTAFQENADAVFQRQEIINGKRVLRVAVADRMTQTCVSCHNSHPESVKKDWKVGDVRAVMEVSKVIEPYLAMAEERSRIVTWSVAIPAGIIAVVLLSGAVVLGRYNAQKRLADENVKYLARHDGMTGLLNRAAFITELTSHLSTKVREQWTIFYIDLDGFKDVNDNFGHGAGDILLKQAADRLQHLSGSEDLLARLGGDEFVLASCRGKTELEQLGQDIVDRLSAPYKLPEREIVISASVGVTSSGEQGECPDRMLEAADLALYRAKMLGKGRVIHYAASMSEEVLQRRRIEQRIKEAQGTDGFELALQPLYDNASSLTGFEALLRLPDGEGGYIAPNVFIPIAEKLGLIAEIGEGVIRRACDLASEWPSELTIAVNLSPLQFRFDVGRKAISEVVLQALQTSGLLPSRLELEITEGLLLEASEEVLEEIRRLKEIGVSIVMDDFGTGYSSLNYFWKLPFDKIKIDRSFVAASAESPETVSPILETIIMLGRTLKMKVTAEGIETHEQANRFTELKCDYYQGYYYGRPASEAQATLTILKEFGKSTASRMRAVAHTSSSARV